MRNTFLTFSLVALAAPGAAAAPSVYRVAESIPVSDGGWDYAQVDPAQHRLYVARAATVTVVDLAHRNAVKDIGAVERGHAVVPIDGGARLLVTSGNDASVRFLDTASGAEIAKVTVGRKPDAALYDAARARAYVMNANDGTVSVIDTKAMRVTATIAVKPALEYAALVGTTLYINNEDANELDVVDLAAGAAGTAIPLTGCEGPTGLGYDERHARLISACANGKAAIVDVKSRRVVLIDIGRGPDAVIMDRARQLAFIPCGRDGVLDILSFATPGAVTRVGRMTTEIGTRTGAIDPVSGAIYLPSARFTAPATPGGRGTAVPGSAHILVVRPA